MFFRALPYPDDPNKRYFRIALTDGDVYPLEDGRCSACGEAFSFSMAGWATLKTESNGLLLHFIHSGCFTPEDREVEGFIGSSNFRGYTPEEVDCGGNGDEASWQVAHHPRISGRGW